MNWSKVDWRRYQQPVVKERTIEERLDAIERRLSMLEGFRWHTSPYMPGYPGKISVGSPNVFPGTTWTGIGMGVATTGGLRN